MAPNQDTTTTTNADELESNERWELVAQWRRAVRTFRLVVSVIMVLVALVVLSEALRFYDIFARLHAIGGYVYLALLVVGLVVFVGVPAWRYWRVPRALKPPDVHLDEERLRHADLVKRARYVDRYCKSLRRNPELASKSKELAEVARRAAELRKKVKSAPSDATMAVVDEIRQFETEAVDPLLKELDAKVDAYIRKEAVAVGAATAVCMNGTLDGFIVLWRAANMVSRISRYYYGRPGLHGSIVLLGDVASAVVLSRAADDLSDMAAELATDAPGGLGAIVQAIPGVRAFAGPILDGTVNTAMVLRVGHLAKRRCRSFEAWDKKSMTQAVSGVAQLVARETVGISKELATQVVSLAAPVAGAAMGAAGVGADAVLGGGRNVWQLLRGLLGGKTDHPDKDVV